MHDISCEKKFEFSDEFVSICTDPERTGLLWVLLTSSSFEHFKMLLLQLYYKGIGPFRDLQDELDALIDYCYAKYKAQHNYRQNIVLDITYSVTVEFCYEQYRQRTNNRVGMGIHVNSAQQVVEGM